MKKITGFIKRNAFVLFILAVFIAVDYPLSHANPVGLNPAFPPNDFEITRRLHPEAVWDKAFFGNSSVIASYDETLGGGYINMGVDYGLVTDLVDMLEGGYAQIGSELAVGLNFLTLYDHMDTNATYIWHKRWYEPYVYFERDKLAGRIKGTVDGWLDGTPYTLNTSGWGKALYYGNMSDEKLEEKRQSFYRLYWELPLSEFEDNLNAIDRLIAYCGKRGIRLRVVWMPWNPLLVVPQIAGEVQAAANARLAAAGIEALNTMDLLEPVYFHDFGHLTAEAGRAVFTDYINLWLSEGIE
jgi:hypothetical protein